MVSVAAILLSSDVPDFSLEMGTHHRLDLSTHMQVGRHVWNLQTGKAVTTCSSRMGVHPCAWSALPPCLFPAVGDACTYTGS